LGGKESTAQFVFPPIQLLLRSQAVNTAAETNSAAAGHHPSAPRAEPPRSLALDKSGQRTLLDKDEIFDEACSVALLVPLINSLQVRARERAALMTKAYALVQKKITSLLEKRALPIAWATSGAIRHLYSFAPHVVLARKIAAAH
jgi:hypothetical protein